MKQHLLLGALALCGGLAAVHAADKKNVLLIAGRPSHGPGEHEHNAGIQLLAAGLRQGASGLVDVEASNYTELCDRRLDWIEAFPG